MTKSSAADELSRAITYKNENSCVIYPSLAGFLVVHLYQVHVGCFVRGKLAQILRRTQVHIVALIVDIRGTPTDITPAGRNSLLCCADVSILASSTTACSDLDTARREDSMGLKLTHLELIFIAVIKTILLTVLVSQDVSFLREQIETPIRQDAILCPPPWLVII